MAYVEATMVKPLSRASQTRLQSGWDHVLVAAQLPVNIHDVNDASCGDAMLQTVLRAPVPFLLLGQTRGS